MLPRWASRLVLAVAVCAASGLVAQDAPLPVGVAFLSVDRKYAGAGEVGLYVREDDGSVHKVWSGEPYDCFAAPDRTTLVVERWKGTVHRLDPEGQVVFSKAGLRTPVDVELAADGTVVVVLNEPGEVVGLDPKTGVLLWRRTGFTRPFDVATDPQGGLIVADSGGGRLVRLDAAGETLWERTGLGFPNTCERLKNDHVLVTTWDAGEVLELDGQGKQVWRAKVDGVVYRAQRREDGTTLVVDGAKGRILILDARGKRVHEETFTPCCVDYEPLLKI
ncbi:MAG: PQQ-binding-like beta-propeller repeat protein [Planctomycetes bacterium]|nr:PQQ-binding-like beta-propeller repeat protein [Planctomycetota bacterium]